MINWKNIASENGLTAKEFTVEVLTIAACVGAVELDKKGATSDEAMRFSYYDEAGKIEVYIKRVQEQQK